MRFPFSQAEKVFNSFAQVEIPETNGKEGKREKSE
jgi:hypothetical protein